MVWRWFEIWLTNVYSGNADVFGRPLMVWWWMAQSWWHEWTAWLDYWSTPALMIAAPAAFAGGISWWLAKDDPSYQRANSFWAFFMFTSLPAIPVMPALWYTQPAAMFVTVKLISVVFIGLVLAALILNANRRGAYQRLCQELADFHNWAQKCLLDYAPHNMRYRNEQDYFDEVKSAHERIKEAQRRSGYSEPFHIRELYEGSTYALTNYRWTAKHFCDERNRSLKRKRRQVLKLYKAKSLKAAMADEEAENQRFVKAIEHQMPWAEAVYRAWCDVCAKYWEVLPFAHGVAGVNRVTHAYNLLEHLKPHVGDLGPLDETTAGKITEAIERKFFEEQRKKGSIIIGYPEYVGNVATRSSAPLMLTPEQPSESIFQHLFIKGKPRGGKSITIRFILTQHQAMKHWGVICISPETELLHERLMPYIPSERFDDVIYIDPNDESSPRPGWNILKTDARLPLNDQIERVVTVLVRALSLRDKMMELLQISVAGLMHRKGSTIKDFPRLFSLTDDSLRREIAALPTLDDYSRKLWSDEVKLDRKSYYRGSYMPLLNQLGPLLRPPLADFFSMDGFNWHEELNLNHRLIYIYTGGLGQGPKMKVFGQLVIGTIQQTLMLRELIPKPYRNYVMALDEFWQYADTSVETFSFIYPQARKYRMYVMTAYQSDENVNDKLVGLMTQLVDNFLIFSVSMKDARFFAEQFRLRDPDGKTVPDIFLDLESGHCVARTYTQRTGVPAAIPYEPLVPRNSEVEVGNLIAHSKAKHGAVVKQQQVINGLIEYGEEDVKPPPEIIKMPPRKRGKTLFDVMEDEEGTFAG